MRANTSRSGALVFGRLVEDYDLGRIPVASDEVETIRSHAFHGNAGTGFGRVLEVGAGTGQLTKALVNQSERLTVLEPDGAFRNILESLLSERLSDGSVRILGTRFEDALNTLDVGSIDEIWSCDAFHWIDPTRGYEVASKLTTANGRLVLLWRFPYAADPGLRQKLNAIFRELCPDLVRDEDFVDQIKLLCAEGRAEMSASGYFVPLGHWWMSRQVPMPPDRFASLQLSLGHIASMDLAARQHLRSAILGAVGLDGLNVRLLTYVVVGSKV